MKLQFEGNLFSYRNINRCLLAKYVCIVYKTIFKLFTFLPYLKKTLFFIAIDLTKFFINEFKIHNDLEYANKI